MSTVKMKAGTHENMKLPKIILFNITFVIEPGVQQRLIPLTILSLESGDIAPRNVATVLDPLLVSEQADHAVMTVF